jgi:hypothetical protein
LVHANLLFAHHNQMPVGQNFCHSRGDVSSKSIGAGGAAFSGKIQRRVLRQLEISRSQRQAKKLKAPSS